MQKARIIGILITDRIKESGQTQKVLTEFGHIIKSRLGFHEVSEAICSRVGMVILQLTGDSKEWDLFEEKLLQIDGVQVKNMSFEY
jgi:metal-responsive CopG/Arc/MetJ family transcriptional regulator